LGLKKKIVELKKEQRKIKSAAAPLDPFARSWVKIEQKGQRRGDLFCRFFFLL